MLMLPKQITNLYIVFNDKWISAHVQLDFRKKTFNIFFWCHFSCKYINYINVRVMDRVKTYF